MLWNPQRTVSTTLIDSAEDQDVAEYSGSPGEFDVVDPTGLGTSWSAPDGTYVIRNQSGQGFSRMFSNTGDGLPNYFPKGNIARCYVRADGLNGASRVLFGLQDLNDYYVAQVGYGVGNLRLLRSDAGTLTELANDANATPSADTTGYLEITWDDGTLGGADNDITVEYFEGGSQVGDTLTSNDSTFATEEGVGFVGSSNDTADLFWDWYHLR